MYVCNVCMYVYILYICTVDKHTIHHIILGELIPDLTGRRQEVELSQNDSEN